MKEQLCYTSQYSRFPADHTCQIKRDIERSGFYWRSQENMPDEICFFDHLLHGEIQPVYAVALTYDEFRTYAGYWFDVGEADAMLASNSYRTVAGYWHISKSSQTIFLTSLHPIVARERLNVDTLAPHNTYVDLAVPVSSFYRSCTIEGARDTTIEGKAFLHCRFRQIYENVTFKHCFFYDVAFEHCTFLNVQFIDCVVRGQMDHVVFDQVSGHNVCWQVSAGQSQLSNARISADHTASTEYWQCELYGVSIVGATYIECVNVTDRKQHTCVVCKQAKRGCLKIHARGWLCPACKHAKFNQTTSDNDRYVGKQDSLPMFSFELETQGTQLDKALVVLAHNFIATRDGTVDVEYKSPRYLSLQACLPALKAIDTFAYTAIDDACGTHLHVDCRVRGYIDADVFRPLVRYLKSHETETEQFWGRLFGNYCTSSVGSGSRYEAFSLQSNHETIEYRLPRFRTAKQYLAVIRYCRMATKLLTDTYTYTPDHLINVSQVGLQLLAMYRSAVASM